MPRWENRDQLFWSKVDRVGECWLWTGCRDKAGYGQTSYRQKPMRSHRLAWILTYGDPGDFHVLHRCDNRRCCRPDHLFLGTHADNMRDMAEKSRRKGRAKGSENGRAKLTQQQANEIRSRYENKKATQMTLAAEYGISQFAVSRIVRGLRY